MSVAHLVVSVRGRSACERAETTARGPQGIPQPRQLTPRIFVIIPEIRGGGPTGVYAVRL